MYSTYLFVQNIISSRDEKALYSQADGEAVFVCLFLPPVTEGVLLALVTGEHAQLVFPSHGTTLCTQRSSDS